MSGDEEGRNVVMARRIETTPVRYPFRFLFAGDSGAWADPTAEAIFGHLMKQIAGFDPPPLFFANVGDFAGPGTPERHERYLDLVQPLSIPNICVVGNHDLDDAVGPETFARFHGPMNFTFAYGHTRFVALHAQASTPGEMDIPEPPEGVEGPRDEDLAFLDQTLKDADEPHRVLLMHMPPYMDGHYDPHPNWGFRIREQAFFDLLHAHKVKLVCCAHGLSFDEHEVAGIRIVMSGGGGTGLCSHLLGICARGPGTPENRGALFHAVEIAVTETGDISGRVIQAFEPDENVSPREFGSASAGSVRS